MQLGKHIASDCNTALHWHAIMKCSASVEPLEFPDMFAPKNTEMAYPKFKKTFCPRRAGTAWSSMRACMKEGAAGAALPRMLWGVAAPMQGLSSFKFVKNLDSQVFLNIRHLNQERTATKTEAKHRHTVSLVAMQSKLAKAIEVWTGW